MPFTVDDTPFGSLSVTLADNDATLAASIMATAPATLSLSVYGAAPGVPLGGTTGQVLKKNSNADWDTTWGTDLASAAWGTITGTLSSQTDLQNALDLKAPLASPALSGVPTAPTAATLTSTTQLATTAFVQQELAAGTAVAKNLEVYVRNQTGSTLAAGTIVYIDGATGNKPTVTKAQANNDANSAQTFGFVKTSIANNGFGYVIVRGEVENLDTSALTDGQQLYLSPTTAGTWTTTKPSAPQHLVYVGIVIRAHPTQGVILVAIQNGYELNELHDVQITTPTNGQVLKYDSATGLWKNQTDASGVAWGGITGTLSNQTDLQNALDAKFNKSGGAFDDGATITIPSTAGAAGIEFASAQMTIESNTAATDFTYVAYNQVLISDADGTTMHSATGITFPDSTFQSTAYPGSTDFLLKAGNLSGLADTSVARTNLGLGTMAVETASNYLTTATASSTYAPLASPALTGTPTAPTASAGTNTTQIATTAFVQTAAPDASTTTKGKVELATVAEAQDGGSTSLVPTVEGVTWMLMNDAYRPYFNLTGGTSGTGASNNLVPPFRYEMAGPSSGTGYAYTQTNNYSGMAEGVGSTLFDFSQKCWISFTLDNISATWIGDANNELKVFWGLNSSNNGDDPNGKAFGVWKQGGASSYWNLMVHNGTTLTKVATTTTMPTGQTQRFLVYSDGAGNVKLYINGTEVASSNAGPTGTRADTRFWASVKQTGTVGTRILNMIFYPKVYSAP